METYLLIQLTDNINSYRLLSLFYDASTPSGVFDDFLAIPATGGNVNTRPFPDLILSVNSLGAASSHYVVKYWLTSSLIWSCITGSD
jgi:hypothetical protein